MKAEEFYSGNFEYVGSCVSLSGNRVEALMTNTIRGNKHIIRKLALDFGIISESEYHMERRFKAYNPYKCLRTKTHAIYIHSRIEYFFERI